MLCFLFPCYLRKFEDSTEKRKPGKLKCFSSAIGTTFFMTRDFQSASEYEDADTSICYQTFSYIGKGVSYAVFPFFHVIFENLKIAQKSGNLANLSAFRQPLAPHSL